VFHDPHEPLRMAVSYTQLLAKEYKGNFDERADHRNRVLKRALSGTGLAICQKLVERYGAEVVMQ
jgi:light-regulated signal transduction histidine kinase (bacteriophytochrome)